MNYLIALIFMAISIILYWVGGEKWAHTQFRDSGCTLCILLSAWFLLGWNIFLLGVLLSYGGFTIGDHEKFYWSIHAFLISLGFLPFAIATKTYLPFTLMSITVTLGTYLVSRFFSRNGVDVWGRGFLYATMPLWFLPGRINRG
jgi:hypothetical protein